MSEAEVIAKKNAEAIRLYAVRIEDLLRLNGATGSGFYKLVQSIFDRLDPKIRMNIERMAELRNEAAHTEFVYCNEKQMSAYEAQYKFVSEALVMMLESKKRDAELVNNLKVTMKVKSGVKRWILGSLIAGLSIGVALHKFTR